MKKIFCILLISILFLSGCDDTTVTSDISNNVNSDNASSTSGEETSDIDKSNNGNSDNTSTTSNEEVSDMDKSCNGNSDIASTTSGREVSFINGVLYEEGVCFDDDLENIDFPFERDCIPDMETAISVTKIFIEIFQQQNYFIDYVPTSVYYGTKDNIWVVTFSKGFDYPGACLIIALRKENAEVIKMWVEE